ncbi:GNAT family N-acetyltransferase [Patescibacteria group bacterium]|nr:GNAT family N-acetyltransferase [Patescibacteria group bacterium]
MQVIGVIKTFRGKGVGKELLQTAGAMLKELGFHYILSSTDQDNLISLSFHKRLGFEKIGVLKFPLSIQNQPEVFLIKKLEKF